MYDEDDDVEEEEDEYGIVCTNDCFHGILSDILRNSCGPSG